MVTFEVPDMTCGHCVNSITKAVRAIGPTARVTADLATRRVQLESIESDSAKLANVIREAGYTPVPVEDVAVSTARRAPRSGCCCR